MNKPENFIMYTGEGGLKEYLTIFFENLGVEKEKIPLKVEEAFQSITNNPNEPNIFGVTVVKHKS